MRGSQFLLGCLLAGVSALVGLPGRSQVVPDRMLGSEASVVRADVEVEGAIADLIEGGATRGSNLFHSFLDFNIDEAERVYFNSPAGVESILGRVTGSNLSNINGLLGTTGASDAALILMNPNGIVFGENARLDVKGAFTATTAAGVQMGEMGFFSATEPEIDNLLSITPSAYFFNNLSDIGDIEISGSRLQVPNGESLMLLGQNVSMDGGRLDAWGGRVSIGTASENRFLRVEDGLLATPGMAQQGVVRLENEAAVDVRLADAGDIQVAAGDIEIVSGSFLSGGIESGFGQVGSQSGDIVLNANGMVIVEDNSLILNTVQPEGVGNAGRISITADSVAVTRGSFISSSVYGTGNAGGVEISARDRVLFSGLGEGIDQTGALSNVGRGGVGQNGDIEIVTDSLTVEAGATLTTSNFGMEDSGDLKITANSVAVVGGSFLSSTAYGAGDAGDVIIQAQDRVLFSGRRADGGNGSFASSSVAREGTGQGGNLRISTNSLVVEAGARLGADTTGAGNAGNVEIAARSVMLLGDASLSSSTIGSGNAGDVIIRASDRVLLDGRDGDFGSNIFSSVGKDGTGQGGNIDIATGSLTAKNGASMNSSTFGSGDAGNVSLQAEEDVVFDNGTRTEENDILTGVFSSVLSGARGRSGDVAISAGSVFFSNGAAVVTGTSGKGDAGDVSIQARDGVNFSGDRADGILVSSVFSRVAPSGQGNGGNVEISADTVSFTDGALITAGTAGNGNAGNVRVRAQDNVLFSGRGTNSAFRSGIDSSVADSGFGEGGSIEVVAGDLTIDSGAQITSSSFGQGGAGDIVLRVQDRAVLEGFEEGETSGSNVSSTAGIGSSGRGGNIDFTARSLRVAGTAQFNTYTFGRGDAGDLSIQVVEDVVFDGEKNTVEAGNGAFSFVGNTAEGTGGNIQVDAESVVLGGGAGLNASTGGEGDAGNIVVNASSTVILDGTTPVSDLLTGFSTATASDRGVGGDITVNAAMIRFEEGAGVTAQTNSSQPGGNVTINAEAVEIVTGGQVVATSNEDGAAGNLSIKGARLLLDGGTVTTDSAGADGGNIAIELMDNLVLRNGSRISATAGTGEASGNGGNVEIAAPVVVAIPTENSDITANAFSGTGGRVRLQSRAVFGLQEREMLTSKSDITASSDQGVDGVVVIESPDTEIVESNVVDLPQGLIGDELVASSCIARDEDDEQGRFVSTGRDLPQRPVDILSSAYSTGDIQPIRSDSSVNIREPQGAYRLADDRLMLSRQCD